VGFSLSASIIHHTKGGYEAEAHKLKKTRNQTRMLRSNGGALLFLQTMLAKMKEPEKGGNRIAMIFNGYLYQMVSLQVIMIKVILIARSVAYMMLNQYLVP
jgi:hypothetical protein